MAEYNDGAIPHGSRIITINSVAYAAESFEISEPTATVERMNVVTNNPAGQVTFPGFITGSAVLQLDNAEIAPPQFANFIAPIRGTNANFYVTDVGTPEALGEAKKVNISFRKAVN